MESIVSLLKTLERLEILSESVDPTELLGRPEGPIRVLAKMGLIDELQTIKTLATALGLETIDLEDLQVQARLQCDSFQELVGNELLWKHHCVPLWRDNWGLHVAVANPFESEILEALEFAASSPVSIHLCDISGIITQLERFFPLAAEDFDSLESLEQDSYVEILRDTEREEEVGNESLDAPPIVRLVNRILADAVRHDASDIHIEPASNRLEVRFRIDGIMHSMLDLPKRVQSRVCSRIKVLAGMDVGERRKPQDGRIRIRVEGVPVDMRVSSVPTSEGEKIVLRLLKRSSEHLSFQKLGIDNENEKKILRALNMRGRLLLVTGPTGSGKTTTLYTCLNYLRDGSTNIETVEDPIEYQIPGIHQIQVHEAAGVTFASALRSILRQDPDIIMIGEIRDAETANIALQAAQTGHLVLSTLHTNDAASAVSRLLSLNADPFVLSSSLVGVLAQRLVRKLCKNCAQEADEEYLARMSGLLPELELHSAKIMMPGTCRQCRLTGYSGRVGLFSYLDVNETIAQAIADERSTGEIRAIASHSGFRDLSEVALNSLLSGETSFEEIRPYLLQAEESNTDGHASERKSHKSAQELGPLDKEKVLIIEDDADVRSILSMLLQKEMYEVVEAANGQEGLEKVYECKPSLIVCDLMMPVMDGREFLKKIQATKQTRDIPVLMLTAVDHENNEIDLIDLGATDFVSKSASSSVLLTRMRRALQGHLN